MHYSPVIPDISFLTLPGAALTLLMSVLLLVLPRRLALLPIAVIACFLTFGQQLVVAGLHFTMLRVLVLIGCTRVALRMEFRSVKWTRLDALILLWVFVDLAAYTLFWQTTGALINRLGTAYNAIGLYFIFRVLIRNTEDIKYVCRIFAVLLVPLAICMSIEKITGRDLFYAFGGVPEFPEIRDGVLRAQGPFRHPILAGTFGAVWLSLFLALWWQGKGNRILAFLGILSSTLITFLAGSTGPLGTYVAGIVGMGMWGMRKHMRTVRWGILAFMVALDIIMKGHVWYIFAYISRNHVGFQGSTGWHRSKLIDATIKHFSDWWLLGTKTTDVANWGVFSGDVTNHYIAQAVNGGLATLILFIFIIVGAFSCIGWAMRALPENSRRSHLLLWAVGSTLFAHVISFLSVTYYDQNIVNWYLVLAMAGTASTVYRRRAEPSPSWARVAGDEINSAALEKT